MAQFFTCATLACCGRREALQAPLQELLDVTADNHFVYLGACARVLKGQWLIESGQAMQGLALTEQALREFEAQEAQLGVPWVQSIMAQGHAQLGRTQRAMDVIERALAATERKGERQWAPEVWRVKAALLRQMHGAGREAETMTALHTALSLARTQGAGSLELRAATDLAALLLAHGERTTADALLASAMDKITQGEASADWHAARALRARCAAP